jgi:hypothetical protein
MKVDLVELLSHYLLDESIDSIKPALDSLSNHIEGLTENELLFLLFLPNPDYYSADQHKNLCAIDWLLSGGDLEPVKRIFLYLKVV